MKHKTPVLMTAENPEGWKLEELLEQLVVELHAKSNKIADVEAPAAKLYRATNSAIISRFLVLAEAQRDAIEYAKANPFTVPTPSEKAS